MAAKVMQLWKQGWNEIPEVMGSSIFAVIAYATAPYVLYKFGSYEQMNKRYKPYYMVYRPDDPRVPRIRRFPDSPTTTSLRDVKPKEVC